MNDLFEMKTSELFGPALDWAVAKAQNVAVVTDPNSPNNRQMVEDDDAPNGWYCYSPSTDWSQGGPLIEQHCMRVDVSFTGWGNIYVDASAIGSPDRIKKQGDTALIAICRAVVAARFGETVRLPGRLILTS